MGNQKGFNCCLGVAAALMSPFAFATDGTFTFGVGPDEYTSYAFDASANAFNTPVSILFNYEASYVSGDNIGRRFGFGLEWTPADWFSATYQRGSTDAAPLELSSNAIGVSVNVGTLWSNRLQTRLDLDYENSEYDSIRRRVGLRVVRIEVPEQFRVGIGLTQDILDNLSIYGSHDFYDYEDDPKALATFLARRRLRPINVIYALTSFADEGSTIGITWSPIEQLSADLSYGMNDTVIDQHSQDVTLNLTYDITDRITLGGGISYSKSDPVLGPRGATLVDGSEGTYFSLSLGAYY